ncbi:MAG: GntR family transcriptional regulator [Pseudomonadota bacterium]
MKLEMDFKERKSLGQDVFDYLKKAIIDQTIEPGSRLVESRISQMLGISRTPLREALHKLEREEWIEKMPSGGLRVVSLTREDIEETFGIRCALESYAARLAAENWVDGDLAPLEKKLNEFQACLDKNNCSRLQAINTEFHDLLYGLSNSPKLIRMIDQLRSQIARFRQMILKQETMAVRSNEDHINMMEAMKRRDGDGVERLVRDHILRGKQAVLDQFREKTN